MFSIKDKRQDIFLLRFTKQISDFQLLEYKTSILNSCFAYILEKRDFDWGEGKMVDII